jgi:AcrR family transcriptional regulator
VLRQAILRAALEELEENGYAGLSMDRVAERARTSKASLYRRWPSRAVLALEVVGWALPDPGRLPDSGDLRADLLALLRGIADRLAGPLGEVVRGLTAETLLDPRLADEARQRITDPAQDRMLGFLHRAAERGEVDPGALTPWTAAVGPVLLRHHFLSHGAPIADGVVVDIVDQVVLPLLRRESPGPEARGPQPGSGPPGASPARSDDP